MRAHRESSVIVYFVLALRSAFRNELSYGAKTPIDTVCITAVCNDRRLRVRLSLLSPLFTLPLSLSLCPLHFTCKRVCPLCLWTHPFSLSEARA